MKLSSACCALAGLVAASGTASAGETQNFFEIYDETQSYIDVIAFEFVDDSKQSDGLFIYHDQLFGVDAAGGFVHNTGVDFNGQSSLSANEVSYLYHSSGFEMHSVQHSEIELGSGYNSGTQNGVVVHGGMHFDVDTQIDVFVRVEYSGISGGTLISSFEMQGAQDPSISQYEIEDPSSEGFYEIAMRVDVLAGDQFEIEVHSFVALEAMEYGVESASGDLSTDVIVRVVPAPGGAGVLAAFATVACRRRHRNSFV